MNNKCKILTLFFIVIGITTTVQALRKKTTTEDEQKTSLKTEKLKLAKKIANTRNTIKALWKTYRALKNKEETTKNLTIQQKSIIKQKRLKYMAQAVKLSKKLSQMEDEFKEMAKIKPIETTIIEEKISTEPLTPAPTPSVTER